MKTRFCILIAAVAVTFGSASLMAQAIPSYYNPITIAKLSPLAPVGSFINVIASSEKGDNFVYARRENGLRTYQTYYWSPTTGSVLMQPLAGYGDIIIMQVNSSGVAVGFCRTSEDDSTPEYRSEPVIWTPQAGTQSMDTEVSAMSSGPGPAMSGVNERGDSVGMRETLANHLGLEAILRKANGTIIVIPGMFRAVRINDNGEVLGSSITGAAASGFAMFGASVWKEGDAKPTPVGPQQGVLSSGFITNAGDIVIPFEEFREEGGQYYQTRNHKVAIVRASNRSVYQVFDKTLSQNVITQFQVSENSQFLVSEFSNAFPTVRHHYFNWNTGVHQEFIPRFSYQPPVLFKNGDVLFENNGNEFISPTAKSRKWDFTFWREGVGERAVRGMVDQLPYPSDVSYKKHSPAASLGGGKLVIHSFDLHKSLGARNVSEISLLTPHFDTDPYVPEVPQPTPQPTPPRASQPAPQPTPKPTPSMTAAELQAERNKIMRQMRSASRIKNPKTRRARILTLRAQLTQLSNQL